MFIAWCVRSSGERATRIIDMRMYAGSSPTSVDHGEELIYI